MENAVQISKKGTGNVMKKKNGVLFGGIVWLQHSTAQSAIRNQTSVSLEGVFLRCLGSEGCRCQTWYQQLSASTGPGKRVRVPTTGHPLLALSPSSLWILQGSHLLTLKLATCFFPSCLCLCFPKSLFLGSFYNWDVQMNSFFNVGEVLPGNECWSTKGLVLES